MLGNICTGWIIKINKLKSIANKGKYKILIKLKKVAMKNSINDSKSIIHNYKLP